MMTDNNETANAAPDPMQQAIDGDLETLRAMNQVKQMEIKDEGFSVDRLPGGVYGFTYAPQQESPMFQKKNYRNFEVHKLADNSIQMVGFVTQEEAGQLSSASENIKVNFYPDPAEKSVKAVCIPLSRVVHTNGPVREAGYVLKLDISPSTDRPS